MVGCDLVFHTGCVATHASCVKSSNKYIHTYIHTYIYIYIYIHIYIYTVGSLFHGALSHLIWLSSAAYSMFHV